MAEESSSTSSHFIFVVVLYFYPELGHPLTSGCLQKYASIDLARSGNVRSSQSCFRTILLGALGEQAGEGNGKWQFGIGLYIFFKDESVLFLSFHAGLEFPFQLLQCLHLMVFPQFCRSGCDQDFLVDFGFSERAIVVKLRVFLSCHVFHRGFLKFICGAPLPGWPEAALGDVGHGPSKFLLYLRWMGVLKQGLRFVLIEEVDLIDGILLEKAFDYAPNDGNRRRYPHIIASEEPRAVHIRQEGEGFLHGIDQLEQSLISRIQQGHPILHLSGYEVVMDNVFQEVDLHLQQLVFSRFGLDYPLGIEDQDRTVVAIPSHYVEQPLAEQLSGLSTGMQFPY